MVLKAYIEEIPIDSNIFIIRIPYLEDNTTKKYVVEATLCNQPGIYGGYKVGDCVYVDFEGYKYQSPNKPVIMGKLYTEAESVDTSIIASNVDITNKVSLPESASIGKYDSKSLFSIEQKSESSDSMLNYMVDKIIEA